MFQCSDLQLLSFRVQHMLTVNWRVQNVNVAGYAGMLVRTSMQ